MEEVIRKLKKELEYYEQHPRVFARTIRAKRALLEQLIKQYNQ